MRRLKQAPGKRRQSPRLTVLETAQLPTQKRGLPRVADARQVPDTFISETALGSAPGIFLVVDRTGHLIRWNEDVNRLTGRTDEDLANETMLSFLTQDDRERFIVQIEEAMVAGQAQGEVRMRLSGDEERDYLLSARHFDVGGESLVVCIGIDYTDFNRLGKALAREKHISDTIIESAPGAFFMIDQNLNLVRWNRFLSEETGLSDAQLRGASILSTIVEEDRGLAAARFMAAFATGFARMEVGVQTPDGLRRFEKSGRRFEVDGVPYLAGYCIDVTERHQAEAHLAQEKAFADALIESAPGAFYVLDSEGNYFRCNSFLRELTGLPESCIGQHPSLLTIHEEDRPIAAAAMREAFENGEAEVEVRISTAGQSVRLYLMTARRFSVGDAKYLVAVGIDTTEQKARIAELQHDASTDDLTGVPNRKQLVDVGQQEFDRARRFGHPLSVWKLDVDRFKLVNETCGHDGGDRALQSLVLVARRALRDWDVLGRWGGEEFAVLLPEIEGGESLLAAERLRQAVATAPISTESGQPMHLTVSIGVADIQDDDDSLQALLNRADKALYTAKQTGRNKVCVADPTTA